HEAVAVLRQNVDAVQLRERKAQRMVAFGQRIDTGLAWTEQPGVKRGGLGGRKPKAALCRRPARLMARLWQRADHGRRKGILARRNAWWHARGGDSKAFGGRHRRLIRSIRRERALDGMTHELMNAARVAETDFGFLRVHVDIDASRIEL